MRTYRLNKKSIALLAFIIFLSVCLFLFLKNESTNNEAPKKATFVKVLEERMKS